MSDVPEKTYKRELAVAMLLALSCLFAFGIVSNDRAFDAAKFLTTPIFAFAGGAFALDAKFKQGRGSGIVS